MSRKGGDGRDANGSALVKAAAWAWYEHATCLEDKSLVEFDVIRRSWHDPKPSRFKLEAKKLAKQQGAKDFDDHHALLDTYEIESISRRLDQLKESNGDKSKVHHKGFLVGDHGSSSDKFTPPQKSKAATSAVGDLRRKPSVTLSDVEYKIHRRKKTSSNKFTGFWQRRAVMCSSSQKDVILGTRTFVHSQEEPEKRKLYSPVPVVKLADCQPNATGRRHTRRSVQLKH